MGRGISGTDWVWPWEAGAGEEGELTAWTDVGFEFAVLALA